MTICLATLPSVVPLNLFLGVVRNYLGRDSITLEQQGECLVGLALTLHGIHPGPGVGGTVGLRVLVAHLGLDARHQRVSEHVMGQAVIAEHAIIGGKPPGQCGVQTRSDAPLCGPLDRVLGLGGINAPARGKCGGIDHLPPRGKHVSVGFDSFILKVRKLAQMGSVSF